MNSSIKLTEDSLRTLNDRLETHTPEQIVEWAHHLFGNRMAVLSAMQKAGCVVCEVVASLGLQKDVPVLFVDTGVNFRETYDTIARMKQRYGLNIISLHPAQTMDEQTKEKGVLYLSTEGQKKCCELRKKEPLKQIIGQYDALIGSLRREEGGRRSRVPVLALDRELNLLRVHPILGMTSEVMEKRIKDKDIVYNVLHDQGYPTIGCDRCTTPVLPNEDERAGRWRHLENENKYCAINPTDRARLDDAEEFIEFPAHIAMRMLDFQI